MDLLRRPRGLVAEELDDPEDLLHLAWWCEPPLELTLRTDALDRLEVVVARVTPRAAEVARDWGPELMAERAVDAARRNEIDTARRLAEAVLSSSAASPVASARATEALGRALAWTGTDASTRQAERVLAEAAELYEALGASEWAGFITFWRGNAVRLRTGDPAGAEELMVKALHRLAPSSPRRSNVLAYYADLLIGQGRWPEAEEALDEAQDLAEVHLDTKSQAYVAWSRARLSSSRVDPTGTERHLSEAERDHGDWFQINIGSTFLADAAELTDRVGLTAQATAYLARAQALDGSDEFVKQAEAVLLARSGDPELALQALQDLVREDWIEKHLQWRHTLLAAWATFRTAREGAGALAATAFSQAAATGGIEVALCTEAELSRALLPLAAASGSAEAHQVLLAGRSLAVHLLGRPRMTGADGAELTVPSGQPAELVRFLATRPDGVPAEQVLDTFFPDVALGVARNRLRQVLARLRSAAPDLVVRDGGVLHLAPAWVDTREFLRAARRVRGARGARAVQLAYGALAQWAGPALPHDAYAGWAADLRHELEHHHLTLLELVVADATRRGSHQEALTGLEALASYRADDASRLQAMARHLHALGRTAAADHVSETISRSRM